MPFDTEKRCLIEIQIGHGSYSQAYAKKTSFAHSNMMNLKISINRVFVRQTKASVFLI